MRRWRHRSRAFRPLPRLTAAGSAPRSHRPRSSCAPTTVGTRRRRRTCCRTLPGYWRPTPPANAPAAFTHYPDVTGFILPNGRRFLMEAPPALTSARYAADFNETKAVGAINSTTRTADQTLMARTWHGVGTTTTSPNLWNIVLADVARARGWSGLDAARGFALMNMTQHDALMTSFTGKFIYGLWRPVTAIREADTDGNSATAPIRRGRRSWRRRRIRGIRAIAPVSAARSRDCSSASSDRTTSRFK